MLLLLVTDRTSTEILFSSSSFTPNASIKVSLGVGVEEMSLGLSGKVGY